MMDVLIKDPDSFDRIVFVMFSTWDKKVYQTERVRFYEQIFDEMSEAVFKDETLSAELKNKLHLLEDYYTTGEWRVDYEADEAGIFPKDLKRGVLSQDGIYNLLDQITSV